MANPKESTNGKPVTMEKFAEIINASFTAADAKAEKRFKALEAKIESGFTEMKIEIQDIKQSVGAVTEQHHQRLRRVETHLGLDELAPEPGK